MAKPILKIVEGPSPTGKSASEVTVLGLATALSAASNAADLFPHDVEGLVQILQFRNQVARAAQKRSRWFGGRLYNKVSGEEPEYIPLSGTHLRQTLFAAAIEPPEFIVASGKYQLSLDVSEAAVTRLSEMRA